MKVKFVRTEEIEIDIPEEQFMNSVLGESVEYDFDSYLSDMNRVELYAENSETGKLVWQADY